MNWRHAAALALCVAAACAKKGPPDSEASSRAAIPDGVEAGASAPSDAGAPALSSMSTTSPSIALGNLDAQIVGREQMIARNANDVAAAHTLVDLLLMRGEYTSQIKDYERADALADALVKKHPESADAHLAHASTLGTFHLFARVLAELDAAEHAGAPKERVAASRATAYMAEGRFDDAAALGVWRDEELLDSVGLASAGALAAERGKPSDADRLFEAARAKYRDVSPFTVAWMDFHRGALLERQGDRVRAKLYFAEANRALPGFAHPAVHLAGLETPANALAILEPLARTSDDPQVDAALADALRRVGRADDVKAPLDRARARYETLVRTHPEAFADHAAQFFLGPGHDPARALDLARRNAQNRHTEPALDLWIAAAMVTGARDEACAGASAGERLPYATPAFKTTLAAILPTCPATMADAPATSAVPSR